MMMQNNKTCCTTKTVDKFKQIVIYLCYVGTADSLFDIVRCYGVQKHNFQKM